MSASIDFHGPYTYRPHHYPHGASAQRPEPYSALSIYGDSNRVTLYFDSRDGLDGLIRAALAARDQWPGSEPGPTVPDAVARTGHSASASSEPPPGHGENHIDNAGHAILATCPECGREMEPDGSHYARSGAHIPAEVTP